MRHGEARLEISHEGVQFNLHIEDVSAADEVRVFVDGIGIEKDPRMDVVHVCGMDPCGCRKDQHQGRLDPCQSG